MDHLPPILLFYSSILLEARHVPFKIMKIIEWQALVTLYALFKICQYNRHRKSIIRTGAFRCRRRVLPLGGVPCKRMLGKRSGSRINQSNRSSSVERSYYELEEIICVCFAHYVMSQRALLSCFKTSESSPVDLRAQRLS